MDDCGATGRRGSINPSPLTADEWKAHYAKLAAKADADFAALPAEVRAMRTRGRNCDD